MPKCSHLNVLTKYGRLNIWLLGCAEIWPVKLEDFVACTELWPLQLCAVWALVEMWPFKLYAVLALVELWPLKLHAFFVRVEMWPSKIYAFLVRVETCPLKLYLFFVCAVTYCMSAFYLGGAFCVNWKFFTHAFWVILFIYKGLHWCNTVCPYAYLRYYLSWLKIGLNKVCNVTESRSCLVCCLYVCRMPARWGRHQKVLPRCNEDPQQTSCKRHANVMQT